MREKVRMLSENLAEYMKPTYELDLLQVIENMNKFVS